MLIFWIVELLSALAIVGLYAWVWRISADLDDQIKLEVRRQVEEHLDRPRARKETYRWQA